jgi:hypothetical protein
MTKKNKTVAKSFKLAVESTPDIANCYQTGLKGLGVHSHKIELSENDLCSGSVDIDTCTKAKYPQSNRWDYALCYKKEVFFVEVHGAKTDEVNKMLKKLQWLKDWLNKEAPEINKLKAKQSPFIWIQSKGCRILTSSVQYRKAIDAGIKPMPKLVLK